ncbi:MAG: hypothetical protein K5987_02665 [Lachnospiraceae bacterium]|nr:hypothetical protein [Lachnospiraceae bacterium]
MSDEGRKRIVVLVFVAGVIIGGIILWFILKSKELDYMPSGWSDARGDDWSRHDKWNGNGDGDGYGNGVSYNGNGDDGYGKGDGYNGNGDSGYGNGDKSDANTEGIVSINDSDYNSEVGLFGDNRWEEYVNDLFGRISPDYSVDALNVLSDEGVELFIRAADLCGTEGNISYKDLDSAGKKRWDEIAEKVHKAKYRYELDELVLTYTLNSGKWKSSVEYNDFQDFLNANYTDRDVREAKLRSGRFYHIITDLDAGMAAKAIGYTWDEAMERVLLTAGDPLAEVMVKQEDYVPAVENNGTAVSENELNVVTKDDLKLPETVKSKVSVVTD